MEAAPGRANHLIILNRGNYVENLQKGTHVLSQPSQVCTIQSVVCTVQFDPHEYISIYILVKYVTRVYVTVYRLCPHLVYHGGQLIMDYYHN